MRRSKFIVVLMVFIISLFISPIHLQAQAYSGNEDATKVSDFDDDYISMNKFRMWSVFKGLGMNDTQACAALGVCQAEGGFRSEIIEYASSSSATGDHYSFGNNIDDYNKYVETYSSKIMDDADFRTQCTEDTLKAYGVSQDAIDRVKNGENVSDSGINVSFYFVNGVGYLGCGLYQFTGSNAVKLFQWSADHENNWYDFDNQMRFFINQFLKES